MRTYDFLTTINVICLKIPVSLRSFMHIDMTELHNSPIYGPVHSRRLGLSLGINLMPSDGKYCTFDCIYCECGYNCERITRTPRPTVSQVVMSLENQLRMMNEQGESPDVLTFAGNGEPTAHPYFAEIVDATITLRNRYCRQARISVLSNATMIHRPEVRSVLMKVDNNIQKLDAADDIYIRLVDRPVGLRYHVDEIIENMRCFNGHVIVQTMFLHGSMDGIDVSNTCERIVGPWLKAIEYIRPGGVMIYTIDRPTPDACLQKALPSELDAICRRVKNMGIDCSVSY